MLTDLTAVDGFTLRQVSNSKRLRKAFLSEAYDLLKFKTHTKHLIVNHRKKWHKKLCTNKKENGERFSITFDEILTLRNRRYMNVNVY